METLRKFQKVVLVTGGCGAIGSEVINRLKALHKDTLFVNLDLLTYAGRKENIEEPMDNYVFIHGNICDDVVVSRVLREYAPQYILHLAAETHVDNSFGNSLKFTLTNVLGTHTLLECVRQWLLQDGNESFKMFVHMSTDEVYGSVKDGEEPRREDALFQPSNPYAASKAGAEMVCKSYELSFKLPICVVRCNNAVSKYQHEEKLIPRVVSCAMRGDKVPVHGLGKSKRTFVHAYDIADALNVVMQKGLVGEIYNIGVDEAIGEYSVIDVVKVVLSKVLRKNVEDIENELDKYIQYVPDRLFQDYRYSIDSSALRLLGWREKIGFEEAVEDVVSWKKADGNQQPL